MSTPTPQMPPDTSNARVPPSNVRVEDTIPYVEGGKYTLRRPEPVAPPRAFEQPPADDSPTVGGLPASEGRMME